MKVKFLPQDIEIEVSSDETVLQAAQRNDVFIKSVCNGVPNCAECRVQLVEGDHNVLQPSQKELQLIGTAHFVDQRRLACQLRCFGDITIDLSEQVEKEQNEDFKRRKKLGVTKDSEVSRAKSGNLIDQDEALLKEVDVEVGDKVFDEPTKQNQPKKQDRNRPNRGRSDSRRQGSGRHGSKGARGNRSGQSKQGASATDSDRGEGSGGSDKPRTGAPKKRNRNRRRNNNKKKPQGDS